MRHLVIWCVCAFACPSWADDAVPQEFRSDLELAVDRFPSPSDRWVAWYRFPSLGGHPRVSGPAVSALSFRGRYLTE